MIDVSNWNLYWNLEGTELVRANLVYSAYISADKKHFCQWFARDGRYHKDIAENALWTEQLLEDRFRKELKYHAKARHHMPTLEIIDIDEIERKIVYDWPGDDFLMQSISAGSRELACPNWKDQWIDLLQCMWAANITKLSLHPNSWTIKDGVMYPINWFFCYDTNDNSDSFQNLLIQISSERLEKMYDVLEKLEMTIQETYPVKKLQEAALNSFRSNYENDFIDIVLKKL